MRGAPCFALPALIAAAEGDANARLWLTAVVSARGRHPSTAPTRESKLQPPAPARIGRRS